MRQLCTRGRVMALLAKRVNTSSAVAEVNPIGLHVNMSRWPRGEWVRTGRARWLAWLTILGTSLFAGLATTADAVDLGPSLAESALTHSIPARLASSPELGFSLAPSRTEPHVVCSPPAPGRAACMSVVDPPAVRVASGFRDAGAGPLFEGGGEEGGLDSKNLQEAYKIPVTGGATETVAVVDAFDDPNAEKDLAKYRASNGLPECKKRNPNKEVTNCFRKVNQEGKEGSYPTDKYPRIGESDEVEDWGEEISLDLDMVSSACPECKIVLVEANSNEDPALYEAEQEAEKLEAGGKKLVTAISNSWSSEEWPEEVEYDKYFAHAGIPITAAGGDYGYGVGYPAASKYVISVGGTTLTKDADSERGWSESVWDATGSGCSKYESQPAWQSGLLCNEGGHYRVDNDVAAVASNDESPVSVYDSYEYEEAGGVGTGKLGWILLGGTSVATPLVAGIEAHASSAVKAEGAEAFYRHRLFDVTSGGNGFGCRGYLCNGEEGYDGPTGWGTPDGALKSAVPPPGHYGAARRKHKAY